MSPAKLVVAVVLAAAALSACGTSAKPIAGSLAARTGHGGRGKVDDPRSTHYKCLVQHHIPVVKVGGTGLQIGSPPAGPTVTFESTPGAAQYLLMSGQVESAEAIGSALLYPNQASDQELGTVETCLAVGVTG
jgi:hypothetical protein